MSRLSNSSFGSIDQVLDQESTSPNPRIREPVSRFQTKTKTETKAASRANTPSPSKYQLPHIYCAMKGATLEYFASVCEEIRKKKDAETSTAVADLTSELSGFSITAGASKGKGKLKEASEEDTAATASTASIASTESTAPEVPPKPTSFAYTTTKKRGRQRHREFRHVTVNQSVLHRVDKAMSKFVSGPTGSTPSDTDPEDEDPGDEDPGDEDPGDEDSMYDEDGDRMTYLGETSERPDDPNDTNQYDKAAPDYPVM
ncbi:hypothetical protein EJ04DRAFT_522724 [Polyplosphaeria fusca]|uniref:Uncharacterized protein n=1 Tax=Polyplosphaeria fusca TaxID=682080 RepID=A0A9P4R2E0_9PLEO|nr:hypothetical protein EJ04DRAFT_522724 [Polyplosphaeria fusca]